MTSSTAVAGVPPPPGSDSNELSVRILQMDEILTNFGDVSSCTRNIATPLWSLRSRSTSDAPPSLNEICDKYAPANLKSQFEQVYRMLHPGLVTRDHNHNVSVFLQGPRGSGKSLLLEQCLEAFQDELRCLDKPKFRIVRLNGILVPGSNVGLVIQEILRQLSTSAFDDVEQSAEEIGNEHDENAEANHEVEDSRPTKKSKTVSDSARELFRLRQTSFTNHVQLLNEILQFACVDDIPILFILDELDSFVGLGGSDLTGSALRIKAMETATKDRQLLLYHLLDRVATGSSFISLVGVTCNYGTMNLLEKRIKSRAEGTKFVHFGPCQTMDDLSVLILDKIRTTSAPTCSLIRSRITEAFSQPSEEGFDPIHKCIWEGFQRSLRLGYNVRWFCRVFYLALSAYRHDCMCQEYHDKHEALPQPPSFSAHYLLNALVAMGGATTSVSGADNAPILDNGMLTDQRIQALRDLTGPQTALIVSAWRILRRDTKKETDSVALTLEKILNEYKTFRGNGKCSAPVLWKAFHSLMDCGLIRPALDHSGRIPLQYEHEDSSYRELAPAVLTSIPLHLNLDIHRELPSAIQRNILNCSTGLREWGKKTT
ncbi:hypothetical protein ACA910_010705 [Epithemia clementina (nom. ined.)]